MIRNLWPIQFTFFYILFDNIIKVNHFFLYPFIILLHLISFFSLTRPLLVPYAYVSFKSIDCILLSSFELKAILSISSVQTLCLSLLNLYSVFNIDFLFLMNSLLFFLRLSMSIFFLDILLYSQVQLLLNSFYNS